jgi:NADH-quinone oxidoreductase subunit K
MEISHYMILSALLFTIGAAGVILKKNIIAIFLCIEIMLNAVNLSFVAFSRFLGQVDGQIFVFFVMVVAAAEAAVGLAIAITLYRNRKTLSVDDADIMKW